MVSSPEAASLVKGDPLGTTAGGNGVDNQHCFLVEDRDEVRCRAAHITYEVNELPTGGCQSKGRRKLDPRCYCTRAIEGKKQNRGLSPLYLEQTLSNNRFLRSEKCHR